MKTSPPPSARDYKQTNDGEDLIHLAATVLDELSSSASVLRTRHVSDFSRVDTDYCVQNRSLAMHYSRADELWKINFSDAARNKSAARSEPRQVGG